MEEADAEVRRFYETSDATGYDTKCLSFQIRNDPIEYTDRLLLYKLALVTRHYRGGPVLDLCCATGQCLLTLAPSIDSGIGLDFSRRFVEAASKRAADLGLRNLAFIQGSATAMPLKSELFGMIYCFSSLYAIPRVDIAIAEIARVPPPGRHGCFGFWQYQIIERLLCEVLHRLGKNLPDHAFSNASESCGEWARYCGTALLPNPAAVGRSTPMG